MNSLENDASCPSESNFREAEKVTSWYPVSSEYPVHIRPLEQGGVEVALYLRELPPPLYEEVFRSDRGQGQLVRKVAERIAAWLAPNS
jgi:hypothetical protein